MSSDNLTPEEIEALLAQSANDTPSEPAADGGAPLPVDNYLTRDEQDLLGELGNICMGTSATTMSTLLGRKVTITTPTVSIQTVESLSRQYPAPLVLSEVKYVRGLTGDNVLILKEYDVALITNLMLGESLDIDENNIELNEIHMSAIGEVMNQMVGSSATALADITHQIVDISTPVTRSLSIKDEGLSDAFGDPENNPIVKISFVMEIEDLLTSEIMQLLTLDFAKQLAAALWDQMQAEMAAPPASAEPAVSEPAPAPAQMMPPPEMAAPQPQPMYQQPYAAPPMQPMQMEMSQPRAVIQEQQNIRVSQPQFPSFSPMAAGVPSLENIEMILDVPMNVTVELGRTKKKIKDILEFNTGSVIVLDRAAGEMVDILVNGKCIGKGEVVVIEDNYGVRISEINIPNASELL